MAYNNIISRTDAQALMPEEVSNAILGGLTDQSAALTLFPRIPISRAQVRLPALSALPTAYFVSGDTGLKQTTEVDWSNKYLNVEELAAIVPIPENVLDDAAFDVWGAIRPLLEQAIGRALDAAVFFGVNKPGSWPNDIATDAAAAGNGYVRGTNAAGAGGLAEDINQAFAKVEADGYDVNGVVTARVMRASLRGARDTLGQRLLDVSASGDSIIGTQVRYSMRGLWPTGAGAAQLFAGDFTQGLIGVRNDFTYKILDQAVIQDGSGAIIYNLAQQDMVALRITFRVAWILANTINYDQPDAAQRYPFAVLHAA